MRFQAGLLLLAALTLIDPALDGQTDSTGPAMLGGLHWRAVGPMRGGRTYGVSGNAAEPDTFYMGSVGGGVWKTENAGRTWLPISDMGTSDTGIPIGSIGAIAVAPSDAKIVYVGTGEPDIRSQHSYGIGMFKSTDAGKSWKAIGLEATRQIGRIVVDPRDSNKLYVAALGHVYRGNADRGVYRSTDGGAHWTKVLASKADPDNVGAVDLAIDPNQPETVYASLWATRRPPWSVYAPSNMPGSGLYKSTDSGSTWTKLGGGLPADDFVGKIGIAVAPSKPSRLWAVVDDTGAAIARPLRAAEGAPKSQPLAKPLGGVYRSDDAGTTWTRVNDEQRLWGRGWYFESVTVDPKNPDKIYVINTGTFESEDAGKTFMPIKAAPGGDDYHQLWVNPNDGKRMVLSSDQGTVVSVDGGKTWSTWYNQPTAQIYHIAADNRFPYTLYGAQQDSGGVAATTWSHDGLLNFRNWYPSCLAGESMTVVPDPKDGNFLFGGGAQRCDQNLNVMASLGGQLPAGDPADPERRTWSLPEVFSAADEALYYSNQFVFRTRDRGRTWEKISPDLSRVNPEVPKTLDAVTAKDIDQPMKDRFGVVYTIAPSPLDAKMVWVGTDDGLIHVTTDDGGAWRNVTPKTMSAWSKVSQVEAGHFAVETAYASVDRHRLADDEPYIYRTHDGGKTWKRVTTGIPVGAFVNSVKEDPKQKGLLYAATELRVYVSFDDGDHWKSLEENMPVTSVRDILVHGNDLAVATYGRGFWVLDQMTPLREMAAEEMQIREERAHLFAPGESYATVVGGQNGTPLPHEEAQELNPPAGVVAYYALKEDTKKPLTVELLDSTGRVRACLASDTPLKPIDTEAIIVQPIWLQPEALPSTTKGMHRVALNVEIPRGFGGGGGGLRGAAPTPLSDACHPPQPKPTGTDVAQARAGTERERGLQPGSYTVRLTVDGRSYTQPAAVLADPRHLPANAEAPEGEEDGH